MIAIIMLTIIRMKRHWQFDDKDDVATDDDIDNADLDDNVAFLAA